MKLICPLHCVVTVDARLALFRQFISAFSKFSSWVILNSICICRCPCGSLLQLDLRIFLRLLTDLMEIHRWFVSIGCSFGSVARVDLYKFLDFRSWFVRFVILLHWHMPVWLSRGVISGWLSPSIEMISCEFNCVEAVKTSFWLQCIFFVLFSAVVSSSQRICSRAVFLSQTRVLDEFSILVQADCIRKPIDVVNGKWWLISSWSFHIFVRMTSL